MTKRITDTTMRDGRQRLLTYCVVSGAVLLILSFLPWLTLHTSGGFGGGGTLSVAGHDLTKLTSFGDGYLVAALSATIVGSACGALLMGRWRSLFVRSMTVAALVIFGIALFEVTRDWPAEYPYSPWPGSRDIDIAPALWAVLATSVLTSLVGLAATVLRPRSPRPAPSDFRFPISDFRTR